MLSYRTDIDGLRAIAVLAVLGFHLIPWNLPGGYIGVDIFFVISGFLITRILWRDLDTDKFSLLNFYTKRIKRLFPALIALLLTCSFIEFLIGLPDEVQAFGLSAISSAFYFSNHYFLSQNDYFDDSLDFNPLLHTWSLSVEEQFYIVFPVLLLLLFRKQKHNSAIILLVIAVSCLALSEALIYINKPASFFITPSRFWQFLAGSIVAIKPLKKPFPKVIMELITLCGLALIILSLFLFSDKSAFPGVSALIPTVGTGMVIFAGQQQGLFTHFLLSNPVAGFFSKISYSLYLWHWPLIVFYKLEIKPEPSSYDRYLLILLSIILGYLSWKLIETPFRHLKIERRSYTTIGLGILASVLVSLISLAFVLTDGGRDRFSTEQLFYIDYLEYDADPYYRTDTCFMTNKTNRISDFQKDICINYHFEKPNVLLVGDSHSAQYFYALKQSIPSVEFSQISSSGCRPVVSYEGAERCTVLMKLALEEYAKEYNFDAIILAGRWESDDLETVSETVDLLSNYTEKVIVLGPIIEYKQALPRLLARYNKDQYELSEARKFDKVQDLDHRMQSVLSPANSEYYSILNTICSKEGCKVFTSEGAPIQFDASHLTHSGALEVVALLVEQGMLKGLIEAQQSNS